MATPQARLRFPRIQSLSLHNFSLFSRKPNVALSISDGVFCLAGANGLGKSTVIAALNFALTGIVSEPGRRFTSVDEYAKFSKDFSQDFFSGRIVERHRKSSEVAVDFTIAGLRYHVVRGVFEPDQLRQLTINAYANGKSAQSVDGESLNAKSRLHTYEARLAADMGLESFEQFVFLQNFILTFDERRHLLFWDDTVLEQALYIAFGVSPQEAQRADVLRRDSEKTGSLARNANWQASELRKKIEELESAIALSRQISETSTIELEAEYKALVSEQEEATAKLEKLDGTVSDINVRVADLSAQLVALRSEYEAEYSKRLSARVDPARHPLIESSVANGQCAVCASKDVKAIDAIREALRSNVCPLCSSPVKPTKPDKKLEQLQVLDRKITDKNEELRDSIEEKKRIAGQHQTVELALKSLSKRFDDFEKENSSFLQTLQIRRGKGSELDGALKRYRDQMQEFLDKKKSYYQRRDEKRKALALLQKKLVAGYSEAEEEFVPLFKELAERFLGLDLNIRLEQRPSTGVAIVLEVKNTARREMYQLSESQRFFIDIALRMALIQHMSAANGKGCLAVDTPEGALDIAYESRAGDMFAQFVQAGFQLVMTANINSSQLLLSLARRCGTAKMTINRMTQWAELSAVQKAEEALFEEAYNKIEGALTKGTVKARASKGPDA
jgi:DNA repair exonuclease SbcCD ATPase subunit